MKNTLLIVDMQKGFVKNEQTINLSKKILTLVERNIFDAVIATKFINASNSVYEKFFSWKSLETETEQALVEGLEKYVDAVCDKNIYNCVTTSFLQRVCQINDGEYPEKLYIVGVDTDCCVLATATSLFENNIRPIVLTQYVQSTGGEESHKAGLLCMRRLIGKAQLVGQLPPPRKRDGACNSQA